MRTPIDTHGAKRAHRNSHRSFVALAGVTLLALALAACGDDDGGGESSATTTTAEATTSSSPTTGSATTGSGTTGGGATAATVAIGQSSLGAILIDDAGMTLYVWDNDTTPGQSSCVDACAEAWPPEEVTGTPTPGPGLDASMFSTVTRDDGSTQLTVNGHPLYGWMGDQKTGDVTGQGVNGFHVVGPDGEKIS